MHELSAIGLQTRAPAEAAASHCGGGRGAACVSTTRSDSIWKANLNKPGGGGAGEREETDPASWGKGRLSRDRFADNMYELALHECDNFRSCA